MPVLPTIADSRHVDLPRLQAGSRPQHLLLTLLGDYWYGQRAPLPSAALVALLEEFDITPVSSRAAFSRLSRRGLLELTKDGRRTAYALSPRAADVLSEGVRHILSFGAREPAWSGRWTLAAFSIPEDKREIRHVLRTRLSWMGFASLYDGLWVSPHERAEQVGAVLAELNISTATLFTAEVPDDSPPDRHPIRAWDLDALRDHYLELLTRFQPMLDRLHAGRIGTAEALVARTALMDAWRHLPNLDPELPAALLPENWPRTQARELFLALYDGLVHLAAQRVIEVIARFDPELAKLVHRHTSDFAG